MRDVKISEKKIAIIFNMYITGDRVDEIMDLFFQRNLNTELLMCEEELDPYRRALELEIDEYSAIAVVGGDGTLN